MDRHEKNTKQCNADTSNENQNGNNFSEKPQLNANPDEDKTIVENQNLKKETDKNSIDNTRCNLVVSNSRKNKTLGSSNSQKNLANYKISADVLWR